MDETSLTGRRILLPQRSSAALRAAIEAAGATVDEVALLARVPVPSPELDALPGQLRSGAVDWLVITSAFTVNALAALGHPLASLVTSQLRLAAVGPASANAVEAAVGRVDLVPWAGTGGMALAAAFPAGPGTVVIPGAAVSSPDLPRELALLGWQVNQIGVYRSRPVDAVDVTVRTRWLAGGYDAIIITAGSVADAAANLLGTGGVAIAVGEPSAKVATRAGFSCVHCAPAATANDLVATLVSALN